MYSNRGKTAERIFMNQIVASKLSRFTLLIFLLSIPLMAQEKEKDAQTGFQFISVTSDARASALGEALTAAGRGSSAMFFNPAGLSHMDGFADVSFSINQWIADIQHNTVGVALRPMDGRFGVFGFSLRSVDYGTLQGTMVWPNGQGFVDTEEFSPAAYSIGVGYAKSLTDRFSVGAHVKHAASDLGRSSILRQDSTYATVKNVAEALAYDFGTMFRFGEKSLTIGMSVKNFSKEITYAHGEEKFQLPLTFTLGVSADIADYVNLPIGESLLVGLDATHPRSHKEQVKLGVEYFPVKILALRSGYILNNDEENVSFGVGVTTAGLAFDYALTPFGNFDKVQRITIRLSI